MAADTTGNVYVADTDNSIIRKITPAGDVSTLAGTAQVVGSADGNGSAAQFSFPTSVAVNNAQWVYVSDYGNHTIRKIAPDKTVTTFAGLAGQAGNADGNQTTARFHSPWGIALDSAENVYVADYANCTLRRITPSAQVMTLAGSPEITGGTDAVGMNARFSFPTGVTVDSTGNAFVSDTFNNLVRKVTPAGSVTTLAGFPNSQGFTDGVGPTVRFNAPSGITVDGNGDLIVADYTNNSIRTGRLASQFSFALRITSVARSGGTILLTGIASPNENVSIMRSPDLVAPFASIGTLKFPSGRLLPVHLSRIERIDQGHLQSGSVQRRNEEYVAWGGRFRKSPVDLRPGLKRLITCQSVGLLPAGEDASARDPFLLAQSDG